VSASRRGQRRPIRPEIQALRALAVTLVLVFHVKPEWVPGGFVGVDVFFVVSGYLIIGHLLEDVGRDRIRLMTFWGRRIRRLLPASFLVLAVSAVATLLVIPSSLWRSTFAQLTASALYVQNWVLARDAVDYLAADDEPSIVQHFWSLSVEEQFYIVVPVVMVITAAVFRRTPRRAIFVVLAIGAVLSLGWSIWLTAADPGTAYFATTTRVWEFALGGLLAFAPALAGGIRRLILSWGGLVTIAVSAFAISGSTPFPGIAALAPVLGTIAVIAGGEVRGRAGSGWLLSTRPVQYIGDISYSLYLWHWPLIVAFPYALGVPLGTAGAALILLASGALAALTKTFVEDRFRTPGPRVWVPFLFAALGAALIATAGFAVTASLDRQREATQESIDQAAASASCFGALGAVNDCVPDPLPVLDPAFAASDLDPIDQGTCGDGRTLEPIVGSQVCAYGEPDAAETVVLVGDSHASQWTAALRDVALVEDWQLIVMTRSSCPFGDLDFERDGAPDTACLDWRDTVMDRLLSDPPERVVVASLRAYGYSLYDMALGSFEDQKAAYGRTLDALVARGIQVTVLGDGPYFPEDVPTCLDRAGAEGCRFARSEVAQSHPDALAAASSSRDDLVYVDVESIVCSADTCPTVIGGVPAYRDRHHLTATFARSFAPILRTAMTTHGD